MMTEEEAAEIVRLELVIEDLRADLTAAHGKLFEAGKFAGQLQAEIDKRAAERTEALRYLEEAHQAIHRVEPMKVLECIAKAMVALG